MKPTSTSPEIHPRARIRLPSSLCKPSLRTYFDWEDSWNGDYAKRPALLDLFAGGGGAAMGYYLAGFRIVGVDIKPQPHFPFEFHQADALTYPLEGFDAYHASPPCQFYTRLRHLPWLRDREYWRSVPPTRELLAQTGKPWVLENVKDCFDLPDSIILDGRMFGLPIFRERRFAASFLLLAPRREKRNGICTPGHASMARRYAASDIAIIEQRGERGTLAYFQEVSGDAGHFTGLERARAAMGIDWMSAKELSQAIPPAFTEYVGKYLMQAVSGVPLES